MNISFNVSELVIDAEIHQWEYDGRKGDLTSNLCIDSGDGNYIFIKFKSPEILSDFCQKHNFPLKDKRNESKN